jgi:hypothetical protein
MLGNRALQSGVISIVTATGASTIGYNLSGSSPNIQVADLIPVSAASAATLTLPPIQPANNYTLGVGGSQLIRIMNLAAQSVVVVADSTNAILGSSATVAQNATAQFVSNGTGTVWYRISG